MKKCPSCGISIADDAVQCPYCQARVYGDTAEVPLPAGETMKCPFCAEEIKSEAIKCRYCGEFLDKSHPAAPKPDAVPHEADAPATGTVTHLNGLKVQISREGKFTQLESGRLEFEGSKVFLKKLIKRQFMFDFASVRSLEHKGSKLIAKMDDTFYVVDFLKLGRDALPYKQTFARLAGAELPEYKAELHPVTVTMIVIGVIVVIAAIIFSIADGCGEDEKPKPKADQAAAASAESANIAPTKAPRKKRPRHVFTEEPQEQPAAKEESRSADDGALLSARDMYVADRGVHEVSQYYELLELLDKRFTNDTPRNIADKAYKTAELCRQQGHVTDGLRALVALRVMSDPFFEPGAQGNVGNNGPEDLFPMWIVLGCD